ncbi:hypothetical protein BDN70DRAFT_654774 [Pholiota conissans]|uniref:Carboxylesterase type B domain-containing protein n=1 Tax=Pholiota conissans TaxID=109636 RepID=A0A9P5Z361_9AGAR|nr:hypothetical protein BDN70DRAFT_654774 [Pholiota conissans]
MTAPPLFRAAITSSTFLPSQYPFNDRIPELIYSEVVAQANCKSGKDCLDCLRSVDANTLQAINKEISANGFFGTFVFVPVVDGDFIIESPTKLLKRHKINSVLLSVTNSFEGASLVNQSTASTVDVSEYISQLFPNIKANAIKAAVALYADLGTNIFQVNAIMGESIFICPTQLLMKAVGKSAYKENLRYRPVYMGRT